MTEAENIFLSKFGMTAVELDLRMSMKRLAKESVKEYQNSVLASVAPQPKVDGVVCNIQQALEISKRALSAVTFGQCLPSLNLIYPR